MTVGSFFPREIAIKSRPAPVFHAVGYFSTTQASSEVLGLGCQLRTGWDQQGERKKQCPRLRGGGRAGRGGRGRIRERAEAMKLQEVAGCVRA